MKGGDMEKKEITMTFRFTVEMHRQIKLLAAREGKTAKECFLEGLDKAFPGWREEEKK